MVDQRHWYEVTVYHSYVHPTQHDVRQFVRPAVLSDRNGAKCDPELAASILNSTWE